MKNPIHSCLSRDRKHLRQKGFALVVTLSLMVLLAIISVAMLGLSSVSLRSTTRNSEMATARANARMAMMLALGELQKTAGLDTRVTARANLLNESNPAILGVWKSWEGTNHDSSGRPVAPNYSNHKKDRFLAWLTSDLENTSMDTPTEATQGLGTVSLVGEGSVGNKNPAQRQVHLKPVNVQVARNSGSYAWWIGGENQKARLPRPHAPASDNPATWSGYSKTHSVADTAPFGLDKLLTDESLKSPSALSPAEKAISKKAMDLLPVSSSGGDPISKEFFHDLSAESTGLLTNTATGGWRKDLSLAAEYWNSASTLPFFRLNPERDLIYSKPTTGSPTPNNALLYHWSSFRQGATDNRAIYSFPAISSWANLMSYMNVYKDFSNTGANGTLSINPRAMAINGDVYSFAHRVRILPVVARIQWVYSHESKMSLTTVGRYDLFLRVTPVITLWNPYNVRINAMGNMRFTLNGSLPPVIEYKIGGAPITFPAPDAGKKFVTLQNNAMDGQTLAQTRGLTGATVYTIMNVPAFAPGETRVFSPDREDNNLVQGYTANQGMRYLVANGVGSTSGTNPASSKITTSVTFDSEYKDAEAVGVGLYLDMEAGVEGQQRHILAYRMSYPKEAANVFYPKFNTGAFQDMSLNQVLERPEPFLLVTFGARMASATHLPSKGFTQSSPFVNYTAMGKKGDVESTIRYTYPGTMHNVNSPFEFSFTALQGADDEMPNADPANHRGYILTGFKSANGLSRCVAAELPSRPVASLGELQNWDARYENPVPPYAFNLVGNSDATPLIPANAVVGAGASAKGSENLQHDDSYCLNHVLFDDWFVSSISPEPAAFGAPPISAQVRTVYTNFLRDLDKPLANRAYKPLPRDRAEAMISTAKANKLAADNVVNPSNSWRTIASRLEVEGMFNVNSTSVAAWRALLGHARNQQIPYTDSSGSPKLSAETDYAVSRFAVAGDVEAGKPGSSAMENGSEYAGYRVFTETQLDSLAEEIVNQVRLRGPFLSLSEFVNRQLSSGDLALAGAVQTALNKLSEGGDSPFSKIQNKATSESPPAPPGISSGYVHSAAARGYSLYGLPGWTRQADIIRPLAPILSARDDTFTIRAYGDCRDSSGNILARVVCEATVRRSRDFVDPADDAASATLSASGGDVQALSPVNQIFGRRFDIVSFRWLSSSEI